MASPPENHCPRCGANLSLSNTQGLCPSCVGRFAFAEDPLDTVSLPVSLGTLRYFGDYELVSEIARGGMGIIYRARQISLGRDVAVKLMRDGALATRDDVERFRTEAAAAAALRHPGIVAIHEIGEHEGQQFFSMDLVEGSNLGDLTREGPLATRRAVELTVQLCEAIQHAHDRGVLHRDLKPANVILDSEGRAHVTDFGLARRETGGSELTLSGQVLGTPGYMAPEQAAGRSREATPASDTYSLGALLYHLLTARAPFTGETPGAVLRQGEENEPVSPRLLNPSVPRDLETIALKALAKDPPSRYPTARALADDLNRFLRGEPILARPVSPAERLWRWCRRKPALASLSGALVILTAAVLGVMTVASIRLALQRRQAEAVKNFLKEILAAPDPNADGKDVRVFDVLRRARERAERELGNQPLVLAEVQSTLGITFYQLALYPDAEPLLQSALHLYQRESGPESIAAAEAHGNLGALYHWSGRTSEGIEELKTAIGILRRNLPESRARLAYFLEDLASAYVGNGQPVLAAEPARECIQLCHHLGTALDHTKAAALGDLSVALWNQNDPGWRPALEESIAINRGRKDGQMNLATSLSNLADSLAEEDALDAAEAAARESLALRQTLFGTNSSPAAFAHARLGTVLLARTNAQGALHEAVTGWNILTNTPTPTDREIQFILRLQGRALVVLGRYGEAEPVLRAAHAASLRSVGPNHIATQGIACILAESLAGQNRAAEALPLLEAGLPLIRSELQHQVRGKIQQRRLEEFEALYRRLKSSPPQADGIGNPAAYPADAPTSRMHGRHPPINASIPTGTRQDRPTFPLLGIAETFFVIPSRLWRCKGWKRF